MSHSSLVDGQPSDYWIGFGKRLKKAKERDKICDDQYEALLGLPYFHRQITGTIERLFFMILVTYNVSGTATAMIIWIAVKMSTDWFIVLKDEREMWKRQLAFSSLLGSIISMLFASIGGLICGFGMFGIEGLR